MKKLLLSLGLLFLTINGFTLTNKNNISKEQKNIKTQIQNHGKEFLSKNFKDYKSLSIIINDTVDINQFISLDSIILAKSVDFDTSEYFKFFKKQIIKESKNFFDEVGINLIDEQIYNSYLKPNYTLKSIYDLFLVSYDRKKYQNKTLHSCMNVFSYKDNLNKLQKDTALFLYTPEEIKMYSTAIKYKDGLNYLSTVKTCKAVLVRKMEKLKSSKK